MQDTALKDTLEEALKTVPKAPTKIAAPGDITFVEHKNPLRDDVDTILSLRHHTHGDFTDNARVMQGLKRVLWNEKGWDKLTDVQREALEMIVHKCGRIISGNPNEPDHWNDIAGYAKLAAQRIER